MRVLLTGHKGYIGMVLAPMLRSAGHEVAGLDTDLFSRCTYGVEPEEIPWVRRDVRDVELTDLQGFDAVIHLAALSNDPLGDLNPDLTYEINHRATVRLAELAKRAGVERFLFSSSCSNYGVSGNERMLTEEAELNPLTAYGKAKVLAERDLRPLASRDFTPVFLRNATAYGISPRVRFDIVVNNLVAWAFTTGGVHLKSDGMSWRPLVHILDISRAFVALLDAPARDVSGQAFNVGISSENYQIRDVAEIVRETVPGSALEFAGGAEADARNYRVDCSRLPRVVPAFRPTWTVARGARELYDAYKQRNLALDEFEGERYRRITHLQSLMRKGLVDETMRPTDLALRAAG